MLIMYRLFTYIVDCLVQRITIKYAPVLFIYVFYCSFLVLFTPFGATKRHIRISIALYLNEIVLINNSGL